MPAKPLCGLGPWRRSYGEDRIVRNGDGVPPQQVQTGQLPDDRSAGRDDRPGKGQWGSGRVASEGRQAVSRPGRRPPRFEGSGPCAMGSRFSSAGPGRTGRNCSVRPFRPEKTLSSRCRIAGHLRAIVGAFLAALAVAAPFAAAPSTRGQAGAEAYVRGYDISGNLLWTREFGSPNYDTALGVTIDASGLYVVGRTEGTLPGEVSAGTVDAFIRKYDFLGNVTWSHQFGTEGFDAADGVAADASGIYVTGETGGTFPGEVTAGGGDGYVRKYDGSGNVLWTHEFGTDANVRAFG